jgi:hypothetical protein
MFRGLLPYGVVSKRFLLLSNLGMIPPTKLGTMFGSTKTGDILQFRDRTMIVGMLDHLAELRLQQDDEKN